MEATPFEQAGEVAVATKWTGDAAVADPFVETVALVGDETYTPATAGKAKKMQAQTQNEFPIRIDDSGRYFSVKRARNEFLACPKGTAKLPGFYVWPQGAANEKALRQQSEVHTGM